MAAVAVAFTLFVRVCSWTVAEVGSSDSAAMESALASVTAQLLERLIRRAGRNAAQKHTGRDVDCGSHAEGAGLRQV